MSVRKSIVLITLARVWLLAQTATPVTTPVPSKWLRDGNLVVPEFNFSIRFPATWSYQDLPKFQGVSATVFIAAVSPEDRYTVVVGDMAVRWILIKRRFS